MEVMEKIRLMNTFTELLTAYHSVSCAGFDLAELALDLCKNDEELARFDALKDPYYDSKDNMSKKIEELQHLINAIPT